MAHHAVMFMRPMTSGLIPTTKIGSYTKPNPPVTNNYNSENSEDSEDNDEISPTNDLLNLNTPSSRFGKSSLHEPMQIPKFDIGDTVYFLHDGKYLKGKVIVFNEEDDIYTIQPVNSSMQQLQINMDQILTKDEFDRKGGKTKKHRRRINKRSKKNRKQTKKSFRRIRKKQTKRKN